jgi:undecaprenyl-diphosphatase
MRKETHQPVTQPLSEGLEPEAGADLETAEPEPGRHPGRTAAVLSIAWVLTLGVIVGIGELIMHSGNGNGNILGDHTVTHWLAAQRTPTLTRWSALFSSLGATQVVLIVVLATCVLAYAISRSWRPVVFIATLMVGELALFLVTAAIVKRPRPDVPNLDPKLPTYAYPSGHVAATLCIWIGIAVLVIGSARGWWRWLFLVPAIVMPILVATSRMYRGEHHPTDILGSLLFAAIWIPAAYALIRPLHRVRSRNRAEPSAREEVPV